MSSWDNERILFAVNPDDSVRTKPVSNQNCVKITCKIRINDELKEPCTVVATGSLSNVIAPLCRNKILLDDDLVLKGLMILYNKNKPNH